MMGNMRDSVLHEEHALLGARFAEGFGGWAAVESYPHADAQPSGDALLCDLTGLRYLLVSGSDVGRVASKALGVPAPAPGRAAHLDYAGGRILLVRCGPSELVVLGAAAAADAEQHLRQAAAGASTQVEDATTMLTPLLLAGAAAPHVLQDYLGKEGALPAAGSVVDTRLDAIPALVASVPDVHTPSYLLLIPPVRAKVLWRSLLSFTEVAPAGLTRTATEGVL